MKIGRNGVDVPGREGARRQLSATVIKSYLLKVGATSFLLKIVYVILQFVASVLLARWLGVEGYGAYSFAVAASSIMAVVAQCGYPGLSLCRSPVLRPGDGLAEGLGQEARRNILLLGLMLAVFVSVVGTGADLQKDSLLIGSLLVPLLGLLALEGSIARALGSVLLGQIPEMLVRPLFILTLVIIASTLSPLEPSVAVGINVLATMIAVVV